MPITIDTVTSPSETTFPARQSSLSPIRIPPPEQTPNILTEDDVVPEELERSKSWSSTAASSPTRKFPPRKSSLSPIDPSGLTGLNGLLAIVSSGGEDRVVEFPIGVDADSRAEQRGRRFGTGTLGDDGLGGGEHSEQDQTSIDISEEGSRAAHPPLATLGTATSGSSGGENTNRSGEDLSQDQLAQDKHKQNKEHRLTVDDNLGLEAQAMFAEAMGGMFLGFESSEPIELSPNLNGEEFTQASDKSKDASDTKGSKMSQADRTLDLETESVSSSPETDKTQRIARPETPSRASESAVRRQRPPSSLSSRLRRRSWLPGQASRSPSPKKRAPSSHGNEPRPISSFTHNPDARLSLIITPSGPAPPKPPSLSKQFANKLRRRDLSLTALDTLAADPPPAASRSTITKSHSSSSITPVRSSDRLSHLMQPDFMNSRTRGARKRDPLYSVFRDLESACSRFVSKIGEQKITVVKSTLSPFFQRYGTHASNTKLNVEDLERRLSILFHWYDALLQFVKSRPFSSLTNQSRVTLLDAILDIMERPEWKHFPSPFAPNATDPASLETPTTASTTYEENDFMVESVRHNIRNWYTQCLRQQMTIVVEKMSLRTVPSMINFCGKTCAYAFFYCPGIAATLIKLWNLKYGTLKRVLTESGIAITANLSTFTNATAGVLPEAMREIVFTSLQEAYKTMKNPMVYPVGTEDCQWNGPWVDRWSGQDSELFYCFLKHYFLILSVHLPEASKTERLVAAGGLYIQAQILVNIDASIRKNFSALDTPAIPPSSQPRRSIHSLDRGMGEEQQPRTPTITFDDMLGEPEPTGTTLSFGNFGSNHNNFGALTNADRNLAENRLILLLKEMLAVYNNEYSIECREAFARLFNDLLRAAAKITYSYNRLESDTLCSFLEETIVIFVRYEQTYSIKAAFLDWEFWIGVWKVMSRNNHFFTEIKILALIYSLWPAITMDSDRKESLCYGFLLDRDYFESRFSHWSPMVRSYYQRLLCWRVAKVHEGVDETHLKILACLQERIKAVYGHYLYNHEKAVMNGTELPKTAPATPAANRRFLIIRADRPSPLLAAFDTSVANAGFKRALAIEQLCAPDIQMGNRETLLDSVRPETSASATSTTDDDLEDSPKRWTRSNLLRSIIGGSRPQSRSKSQSPSRSVSQTDLQSRPPTSNPENHARTGSATSITGSSAATDDAVATWKRRQSNLYRPYCFKFSLESVERRPPTLTSPQLHAPRLPQPAHILLQRHLRGLSLNPSNISSEPAPDPHIGLSSQKSSHHPPASLPKDDHHPPEDSHPRPDSLSLPPQQLPEPSSSKVARETSAYCGRALAEWSGLIGEAQMFFERRKAEGVPGNRYVETPLLGAEAAGRGPRG